MTEEQDITIIEGYREELAPRIAEMFNGWNELWPGGFTGGVPYTAERVHKIYSKMRAITILIAMHKDKPVGFLSLLQHWRDPEAAYIGLLGVSPEVLKKKVGKRLLLRSIAIATEKGYLRVDLNTWSGNTRAVPLYKKIGLMWNPETDGVYLQGWIPGILQHPLCKPFFLKHSDPQAWYTLQQRELTQAPDDMHEGKMNVFIYSFKSGEDSLRVIVDRYARAITGIERVIDGEHLQINARIPDHLTLCGIPSSYILEITNKTKADLELSVSLEGFEALHFTEKHETILKAPMGEVSVWSVPFHLDSSAQVFRKDQKSPTITAKMNLSGTDVTLHTGLKIKPAAEITTHFGETRIVPGGTSQLPLTITSNVPTPLQGKLRFDSPNGALTVSPMECDVEITPEGLAGAVIEVRAKEDAPLGTFDLRAALHLQENVSKGLKVTTRKYRLPIYCIPEGGVTVGEDDRTRQVQVVSADYSAYIAREGGQIQILSHLGSISSLVLRNEVGPPFGLSPFRFAEQEIDVKQSASATTVSLTAVHPERPLTVITRLIFPHSSSVISQETLVTNTGKEEHSFQLRLIGPGGGITLSTGTAVLPLASGTVEESTSSNLISYPSIQTKPEVFREEWIAIEGESLTIGQVWDPENLEEIQVNTGRISQLQYRQVTLKPSEQKCLSRVWHIMRAPRWTAIQRVWQEKIKHQLPLRSVIRASPETITALQITPPTIIIPHRRKTNCEYTIRYSASTPLSGPLSIDPPIGWSAKLKLLDAKADAVPIMLSEITKDNPPTLRVALSPNKSTPDRFRLFKANMTWQTPVQTRQSFSILQLGTSGSQIDILEEREKDLRVFLVKNGLLEFAVSPDFGGCLYSLKNQQGTELLCSAFPTPQPKIFIQNYYGGVQPVISGTDEDTFAAKTNLEEMRAKICTQGKLWKGIEVSWQSKLQEVSRGVEFKLRYLTAPGSPLILMDWHFINTTAAPLRLLTALLMDVGFDGSVSDSILQARWSNRFTQIRPSPTPAAFTPDTGVVWLKRGSSETDSPEGLALLTAGRRKTILALHIGMAVWIGNFDANVWLRPGEELVQRCCLIVNPTNSEELEDLQRILHEL
jgi:ribosomal protein S18 acetylase RimI-like enzyme